MIKGIYQDATPENIPQGYAFYAKNNINNKLLNACINEKGNLIKLAGFTEFNIDFINGIHVLGLDIIICYKTVNNHDCILVWNQETNIKTVKLDRTDFNFNKNYPFDIEGKYNFNGDIIVVITDDLNHSRYINLSNTTQGINYYNLFPISYNPSNINLSIQTNGNILSGAYFIAIQYITKERTRSVFSPLSDVIYITATDESSTFINNKGVNTNQVTNKSIKIDLKNLDITYQKVAIVVLSKVNQIVSARIIKEVNITNTNISTIYNGTEFLNDITLEDLLEIQPVYKTAKHITQVNDELFLADLTVEEETDFQLIANQTILEWNSKYDDINNLVNSSKFKAGNIKTFAHDEVYAMYIQFELQNGRYTRAFHIPGRPLSITANSTSSAVSDSGGLLVNGHAPKVYQLDDTCTFDGTNVDGSKYGSLGIWANESEQYPSNFPGTTLDIFLSPIPFANQPVYHHKFPSIQFISENVWNSKLGYGINSLDILNIQVSNSSIFSNSNIKGYRLLYAKREISEVSSLGMGLCTFAAHDEANNNISSTGGNFNVAPADIVAKGIFVDKSYLRFNSFDIWQDRPFISNTYLRNYIKLKADKLSQDVIGDAVSSTYGIIFNGDTAKNLVGIFSNFTTQGINNTSKSIVGTTYKCRKLTKQTYVPNNIKYTLDGLDIENTWREETLLAKIEGTILDINTSTNIRTDINDPVTMPPNPTDTFYEETYLSAIKTLKSDYFIGFDNKSLVAIPGIIRNITKNVLSGGDNFIFIYSYSTTAPYRFDEYTDGVGIFNHKAHVGEGRHNPQQRYLVNGDYSTYFWPDADQNMAQVSGSDITKKWFYLAIQPNAGAIKFNQFKYSKDFSTINEYENITIFDRDSSFDDDFAYRIQRSVKASREGSLEDGWRSFKPLDYFDCKRNRGPITNILGWGEDILIIHYRDAITRTRDKTVLQTSNLSVQLGSGDIFEIEPKEENSTQYGYGGTQHKHACLLCDIGYVYTDASRGEVFLYNGQLKNITSGLRNFFKKYLKANKDNPFNDTGITIAYDPETYHILLSLKADKKFTIAYDTIKNEWGGFRDYLPDILFNTKNTLFSLLSKNIYQHNIGKYGEYYGIKYPFFIDFIFNSEPDKEKVLASVQWLSKLYNNNIIDRNKSITHITIWNDIFTTGKINIKVNLTDSLFEDLKCNTKINLNTEWSFNDVYSKTKSYDFNEDIFGDYREKASSIEQPAWMISEPIRGKYFVVRLEYDNLEENEIQLLLATGDIRLSK